MKMFSKILTATVFVCINHFQCSSWTFKYMYVALCVDSYQDWIHCKLWDHKSTCYFNPFMLKLKLHTRSTKGLKPSERQTYKWNQFKAVDLITKNQEDLFCTLPCILRLLHCSRIHCCFTQKSVHVWCTFFLFVFWMEMRYIYVFTPWNCTGVPSKGILKWT